MPGSTAPSARRPTHPHTQPTHTHSHPAPRDRAPGPAPGCAPALHFPETALQPPLPAPPSSPAPALLLRACRKQPAAPGACGPWRGGAPWAPGRARACPATRCVAATPPRSHAGARCGAAPLRSGRGLRETGVGPHWPVGVPGAGVGARGGGNSKALVWCGRERVRRCEP